MTDSLESQEWFQKEFSAVPGANELARTWVGLVKNNNFANHLQMLQFIETGLDPLPDRDAIEHLLRGAGHDFAAQQALSRGTLLRQLFRGNYICQEDFIGLHATITARLMHRRAALSEPDVQVLYSTLDRMLRGGHEWPSVSRVSAVDRAFYATLSRIKIPLKAAIRTPLKGLFKEPGLKRFGEPFERLHHFSGACLDILTVAVAHRHGHREATPEDAVEAGFGFTRLFDVDLRQLPLVQREGKSGYEVAG